LGKAEKGVGMVNPGGWWVMVKTDARRLIRSRRGRARFSARRDDESRRMSTVEQGPEARVESAADARIIAIEYHASWFQQRHCARI
jgi:hypothetical protein